MGRRCFITASKSRAIGFAQVPVNGGITELIAIVDVGLAVVIEVPVRAFHAVVKSSPLNFIEFAWRLLPSPVLSISHRLWG
jgi:hypothetical protein